MKSWGPPFFVALFLGITSCTSFTQPIAPDPQDWFETRQRAGDRYETLEPCSAEAAIVRNNGLYGVIDRRGNLLHPLLYTHIYRATDSVLIVQKGSQAGALDVRGAWIVPVAFAEVIAFPLGGGIVAARRDSLFAVFNAGGRQVTPFQFQEVKDIVPGRIVARTGAGGWSGWDSSGKQLLAEQYDDLKALPGGFWEACRYGQCALLGPAGAARTEFRYQQVIGYPDGYYLASTAERDLFDWYDTSGKRLSDRSFYIYTAPDRQGWSLPAWPAGWAWFRWTERPVPLPGNVMVNIQAGAPADWRLLVVDGGEEGNIYGWMDLTTGQTMPPKFQGVIFQNGRILAADGEKTWVYDRQNRVLRSYPFKTDLVAGARAWVIHSNAGAGVCDTAFRILVPQQQYPIDPTPWGGFTVGTQQGVLVCDPNGKPLFPEAVESVDQDRPHGQRLLLYRDKKTAIGDFNGKIIIPAGYIRLEGKIFDGNYTGLGSDGPALLNHRGAVLIPAAGYERLEEVGPWGLVRVARTGKYGLADARTGRFILPVEFDEILFYDTLGIQTRRNGQYAVYDYRGKELVPGLCNKITWLTGCRLVCSGGKWGILDEQLQPIEPFVYDAMGFQNGIVTARQGTNVRHWLVRDKGLAPTRLEKVRYLGEWADSPYWGVIAGKWGLFDRADKPVLQPVYEQVVDVGQNGILAAAQRGGQADLVDIELQIAERFEADTLLDVQQTFLRYRLKDQLWVRNLLNGASAPCAAGEWRAYPPSGLLALPTEKGIQLYSDQLRPVLSGALDALPVASETFCDLLIAEQNGRKGLLGKSGNLVLPFEYDDIYSESGSMYTLVYQLIKGSKRGFYNCLTGKLLPALYDYYQFVETTGFLLAGAEGKMALISPEMKQLTGFELAGAQSFGTGFLLIQRTDWVSGLMHKNGEPAFPLELTNVSRLGDYLSAQRKGKTGLIGPDGRTLLDFRFESVELLGEHAFLTREPNAIQRLFDKQGREITPQPCQYIQAVGDSSFLITLPNGTQGIIGLDGRILLPLETRKITCRDNGPCFEEKAGKWGMLDASGTVLLPYDYDFIDGIYEGPGPYVVGKQGRYGYVDARGRLLTGLDYDYADLFSMGRAAVRRDGKWGFLDISGRELVPPRFDYLENFRYDSTEAAALLNGRYVLVDAAGRVTRDFPYDQPRAASYFQRELEYVSHPGQGSAIKDRQGRVLLQKPGLRFWHVQGGLVAYAAVSPDDCVRPPYGLMNYAGAPLGPAVYTHLGLTHLGVCYFIPAIRDKQWGFLDGRGQTAIPFEYERTWNLNQPFKNGAWRGGVHRAGKSWTIDRTGKWWPDE